MANGLAQLTASPYSNGPLDVGPSPYATIAPESAPSLNEFQKGLKRGALGLQADLYGSVAAAGNALGNQSIQQTGDTGYADASVAAGAADELAGRVEAGT